MDRDEVFKKRSWFLYDFDIIDKIESNYMSGFYKIQRFAFDPRNAWGRDIVESNTDKGAKRDFPVIMCEALEGKHIDCQETDNEYDNGIPTHLESEVNRLAELMELSGLLTY